MHVIRLNMSISQLEDLVERQVEEIEDLLLKLERYKEDFITMEEEYEKLKKELDQLKTTAE